MLFVRYYWSFSRIERARFFRVAFFTRNLTAMACLRNLISMAFLRNLIAMVFFKKLDRDGVFKNLKAMAYLEI